MKKFVALARVSSREQEREGFSLEIQEEALNRYATQAGGEIVKLFKIAETASKRDERKTFRELISYAKKNSPFLHALLFYKLDRAARNLFDYVELERLESEYDLPFISVSQPTENTPAGRMMRRTLANMASFYTEQQSLDVREGLARRVSEGLFIGLAPYGYKNVRKNGRGLIEIATEEAKNVKKIFHLYAYENLTLDGVTERLHFEGYRFRDSQPRFPRSTVHNILKDRAYIGEISHKGHWYPGKHEPLIDRSTWNRVQSLLGGHVYQAQTHTFAGQLIQCGFCGHPITGETITKRTKSGEHYYTYYRCTYYNVNGHPRIRVREADLENQIFALFEKMKVEDQEVKDWFRYVLASQTRDAQADALSQRQELQRQETLLIQQQDRLLTMRLSDQIDHETFARKQTELRDRLSGIKLQIDVIERSHAETADLACKVFELSQTLKEKWVTSDHAAKRRLLDILFLNSILDGVNLCPVIRKPFDILAEGFISKKSRGERI